MATAQPILMTPGDAELAQDLLKALRNIRGSGGVEVIINPGVGITITGRSSGGRGGIPAASGVQIVYLHTVKDNYLVCTLLPQQDTTPSTIQFVNVAKLPEMQKSEYHGKTVNIPFDSEQLIFNYTNPQIRTVTKVSNGAMETQTILPRYIPFKKMPPFDGSRILALTIPTMTIKEDDGTTDLEVTMIEVSNRAWAKI